MTVTGLDHTGIIAAVSQTLASQRVNIVNVSQTLMDEYFTMIMLLEFDPEVVSLRALQDAMKSVETAERLEIRVQAEAIFNTMHSLGTGFHPLNFCQSRVRAEPTCRMAPHEPAAPTTHQTERNR